MSIKTAGAACPIEVVGNLEETSHARVCPVGHLLRAFTTYLILQLEISYVSIRSEQSANANMSVSKAFIAFTHKDIKHF